MLKKTSTQITIGIVCITFFLLLFISIFSYIKVQEDLQAFRVIYNPVTNSTDVVVTKVPTHIADLIKDKTEQFNTRLLQTIILAAGIGFALCIIAGFAFGKIITKPLNNLQKGFKSLKSNNYKFRIEKTGGEEFDEVIDEFNSLAQELEYQEELRKDLISDVSHELKTPITSLLGQVQGIKDGVFKVDENRLNIILSEITRLKDLADKLNDYTRLRSKLTKLVKEKIDITKVIEKIQGWYLGIFEEKNIKFSYTVEKDFKIKANQEMLESIISNIIDNAVKYADATEISVDVKKDLISIHDNGIGISEQHIEKIFERFYRVEESRSRETGGLGLGLSLVKEMVEAHNWTIQAKSEKSKGTTFYIQLS